MKKVGSWCVVYKTPKNFCEEKILQRINSNGVVISASKYSQILGFTTFEAAMREAKKLLSPEYNYRVDVKKFFISGTDDFYLS